MQSHEAGGTAFLAFPAKAGDEVVVVNFVVFEDRELDLLPDVFLALGLGVNLLLALFTTTAKTEDEVEGRLLLDVVVSQGAAV